MHHSTWYPCTKQKAVSSNRHNFWNTKHLEEQQGLDKTNAISLFEIFFSYSCTSSHPQNKCQYCTREVRWRTLQFYLGHSNKIPINRKTQEIDAVAECSLYQLTQMCPLKGFQQVPLPCLPAICQLFSPFLSSLISPLSLPFSFPLWDHALWLCFTFSIAISPSLPSSQTQTPDPCLPALAWPGLSSPCHQPWLLSSLTLFISYVWSP